MATRGMTVLRVDGTDYTINDPNLAGEFSTSTAYKIGQYVNYQGDLYRFTTNHAAGAWNSSHVKKVSFTDEVKEIKNALNGSSVFSAKVERGSITINGAEQDDDQRLRTGLIDVSDVDYISVIVQSGFRMAILFYNADGTYAGSSYDWGNITATNKKYDVSTRAAIRCVIINTDPPNGYVMPYEAAQSNFVIVPKSSNNFMGSTMDHYIERDADGVYFRWENVIWLRGSLTGTLPATDDSGLTLTDSPLGVGDCVYIAGNKTLAVNTADMSLEVIDTEALYENIPVIPLLSIITMMHHKGKANGILRDLIDEGERTFLTENEVMSLTYEKEPYFEYSGSSGVYFNLNGGAGYLRGYTTGRNWIDMASIPLAEGISLVTSPMGKTNCLFIPHNKSLIWVPFVNKCFLVDNVDMWKYPYSVLIFQVIGNKGHDMITNGIGNRSIKYVNDSEGITIDNGNVFFDYNSSLSSIGDDFETFMFFSDPHVMDHSNSFNSAKLANFVNALRFGYENTPTSFIVDGGDWLNYGDYIPNACYKLGLIDGAMRKNFPNYYPADGNHDTNYQGDVSEEDDSSGDLTKETMIALHWRENKAMYYSFDGPNTKNYVFDSGTDWATSMDAYRWGQVDWFAKKLLEDDPEHGIVWVHIAFTDWQTYDVTQISNLMQNVGTIIEKYNARQSVTLNGETYDFSSATGKVWAVMCGHTHYDMNGTLGGVPVVSVINAVHEGVVSYDLGYFDFDNEVLKLFRIGSGSNRTINL